MKYRITPLNIFSVILLFLSLAVYVDPADDGWMSLSILFYLLPGAIGGLILDFFFQIFILRKYGRVVIVEAIIIIIYLLISLTLFSKF